MLEIYCESSMFRVKLLEFSISRYCTVLNEMLFYIQQHVFRCLYNKFSSHRLYVTEINLRSYIQRAHSCIYCIISRIWIKKLIINIVRASDGYYINVPAAKVHRNQSIITISAVFVLSSLPHGAQWPVLRAHLRTTTTTALTRTPRNLLETMSRTG